MKKIKTKPSYTILQNVGFIFANLWKSNRALLFYCIARVPIIVLVSLAATYMSRNVVALVTENAALQTLLLSIGGLSLGLLLLKLSDIYTKNRIDAMQFRNRMIYINQMCAKMMDMDYQLIEHPDGQTALMKAFSTVNNDTSGTEAIIGQLIDIGSNLVGLITYAVILMSLQPLIVLALTTMTIIIYLLNLANNRWAHKNKDNWTPIDRKLDYLLQKSGDFEQAKDTRLYSMSSWFRTLFANILGERGRWWKQEETRGFSIKAVTALLSFVRDGAAYGYLVWQILQNNMSAADFVLFFGIIGQYSVWMYGLFTAFSELDATSLGLCDLRAFLHMPDHSNRGKGLPLPEGPIEITFEHVHFAYEGNEKDTLNDLHFTIEKGEKIAIVGINGAGKTTLVKLLCGLYMPTGGRILVNGAPISDYNRDEYYDLFAAVFQDIHLMPLTMSENVALQLGEMPRQRVQECLELAGLGKKIETLPDGMDTLLVKSVFDGATDLSGGEKQKLALARALYKNAQMLVLDEPTAALDPIAENEMYLRYNELTQGHTSLFISHRLSSTRFCDRILFLEDGRIAESGSHNELMARKGKYAEMFEIQAHYYKEGVENVETIEG